MTIQKYIAATGLSLSLIAFSGAALAQDTGGPVINADGNAVKSTAGVNPVADAGGPTIVYGDLDPGAGVNVIGPPAATSAPVSIPGTDVTATNGDAAALGPGSASAAPGTVTSGTALLGPDGTYSVTEVAPSNVTVGESGTLPPVAETAPVEAVPVEAAPVEAAPVETAPVDTTVASTADLDGDNYADELEWNLGLDGNNPDTDDDGVADGDELNIYGTEPTLYDTDGDGIADGEELFGVMTDPLVWDTDGDGLGDGQVATV